VIVESNESDIGAEPYQSEMLNMDTPLPNDSLQYDMNPDPLPEVQPEVQPEVLDKVIQSAEEVVDQSTEDMLDDQLVQEDSPADGPQLEDLGEVNMQVEPEATLVP
jgi:hypothetical protein